MHWLVMAAMNGGQGTVTLSGETVTQVDPISPYDSIVGIRVNADGTIDSVKAVNNGAKTYAQIDAATDWIIPNGKASSNYDVRITSLSLHANHSWSVQAAAENTWIDLGTDREYSVNSTSLGTNSTTFTLEIRGPSGSTLDTASYTLTTDHTN